MVYLSYQNTSSYLSVQDSAFPLDNDQSLSTCGASLQTVSPWELSMRQSGVGVGGVVGPAPAASTLWGLAGEMEVLANNNNKVRGARGLFDIFQ